MKNEVLNAVNEQINFEFLSAYLYLDMSGKMDDAGFPGFSNWLKKQWHEELEHAEKLIDFVQRRNEAVTLKAIPLEEVKGTTPLELAKEVLEHEQLVTSKIYALRKLAMDEGDQALEVFLNWYVKEQVEEEENAQELIDMFEAAEDSTAAMFQVDSLLAQR